MVLTWICVSDIRCETETQKIPRSYTYCFLHNENLSSFKVLTHVKTGMGVGQNMLKQGEEGEGGLK